MATLLQQIGGLNHSERVKHMVEIGKKAKDDEASKLLVKSLFSGMLYEQSLSLETCYGSRDISIAQQALNLSSSRHLKKRALIIIGLFGTDQEFLGALNSVTTYLQTKAIRRFRDAVRHRQRLPVIESFLEDLESTKRDPSLFKTLLPCGSKAILARNLPQLIDYFTLVDWSHLAKYHPDTTLRSLQDWLHRSSSADHQLVATTKHVLTNWLAHDYSIDRAIALFKLSLEKLPLEKFPAKELIEKRPKEVFQIILDSKANLGEDDIERLKSKTLRQLPLEQFLAVFKRFPDIIDSWNTPASFDELTFEQRKALYKIVRVGWRAFGGRLDKISIEKLATEDRIKEGRRHLKLKKFVTDPEGKIPYIAMLPWDEAMELQKPFLNSSDATNRGIAMRHQIMAGKFDDEHLIDAVKIAVSCKNEQDPVKLEVVTGLVDIPAARWKAEHFEGLEAVVRNFLDSSDTSAGTIDLLCRLIMKILSFHPRWAAKQLAVIIDERKPNMYGMNFQAAGTVPAKEVMAIVSEELAPIIARYVEKNAGDAISDLVPAFDIYTKYWTDMLDACEKILDDPDNEEHHSFMVDTLKKHRPEKWHSLVSTVFGGGKEHLYKLGPIAKSVHTRHQNFLDHYFEANEKDFTENRDALQEQITLSPSRFWSWQTSQQEKYAKILLEEINDEDAILDKKYKDIKQFAALSLIPASHIIKIANDDKHPVLQEVAVRSLAKLDNGQGLPVLIEAFADIRARIAIYSIKTALRYLPKSETFTLLKAAPQEKMTVMKEKLRLVGELGTDEAFTYLLEQTKEELHADVRLALFRALLSFTDRDETWAFFQRTAQAPEADIAKVICTIPSDGLPTPSRTALLKLYLQLLNHTEPVVRVEALKKLTSSPIYDPTNTLSPRIIDFVYSDLPEEVEHASSAILRLYATTNIDLIVATYRKLLKDMKKLTAFHSEYWYASIGRREEFNKLTHAVLAVLAESRFTVKLRIKVMFEVLLWPEIKPYLIAIIPELHADALAEAERNIEEGWSRWLRTFDSLEEAELELAKSEDERARRLALALLIKGIDDEKGWKRAQLDRLERYRADSSPLIVERAWEVTVGEENDLDDEEEEGENEGETSTS